MTGHYWVSGGRTLDHMHDCVSQLVEGYPLYLVAESYPVYRVVKYYPVPV